MVLFAEGVPAVVMVLDPDLPADAESHREEAAVVDDVGETER